MFDTLSRGGVQWGKGVVRGGDHIRKEGGLRRMALGRLVREERVGQIVVRWGMGRRRVAFLPIERRFKWGGGSGSLEGRNLCRKQGSFFAH